VIDPRASDGSTTTGRAGWRRLDPFASCVLGLLALYTLLAWTPSSYGVVFDRLGAERAGLVAGQPREIREDEYERWTPYVQAAVRNEFRRVNETSLYREEMVTPEGLPLADWGLAFKPYYWAFFAVDPAHAFSFYHAFWIGVFLLGYERLFRALGATRGEAAFASLALFFSGFSQAWWTTYGPQLGGFPWLLVIWFAPLHAGVRFAASAYVAVSWLFALLYPPVAITMVFVAAVVVFAMRRDALAPRRLLPFAIGASVGAGLAVLYFHDLLQAWAGTYYPGQRRSGGGGMSFAQWLSQAMPSLVIDGERGLLNDNVCEAATVGSFLPVLALCFVDWGAWMHRLRSAEGRPSGVAIATLLAGATLPSLWILAPIPQALGTPLFWHVVPPIRMWFACGLLIFLLGFAVLRYAPLRLSWQRAAMLAALVIGTHLVVQRALDGGTGWIASSAALLAAVAVVVGLRRRLAHAIPASLVGCAALANAVAFGGFNPVQSAVPLFETPPTPGGAALERLAARHPRRWIALAGSEGAWLNGLGYASAAHVLYTPQLDTFRALFPGLAEAEREKLFNRALWLYPMPGLRPYLIDGPSVEVPIHAFETPSIRVHLGELGALPKAVRRDGAIETASVFERDGVAMIRWSGWAPIDGADPAASLHVATSLPVARAVAYPSLRGDVSRARGDPGLVLSGFALLLELSPSAAALRSPPAKLLQTPFCVVSESPSRGTFELRGGGCGPR
jgi:hypothetical protein